jgi:hypothetical protein
MGGEHRIGRGVGPQLVEEDGDDPHRALGRGDDAFGGVGRQAGRLGEDLVDGDRHRRRVEDRAVDELRGFVQDVGQEPSGDDQAERVGGILDQLGEVVDGSPIEQVGVVEQDAGHVAAPHVGKRRQLTPRSQRATGRDAARQPRLAEARWGFEQHEARRFVSGQSGQQRGAGETHSCWAIP